jgi:Major capsid protein Gp23
MHNTLRHFLKHTELSSDLTPHKADLVAACDKLPLLVSGASGVEHEHKLTCHQEAVMRLVQRNMRHEYEYLSEELTKATGFPASIPDSAIELIDEIFPRQFRKMRLFDLCGVHGAQGPCNIMFMENGEPYSNPEWMHDHLVRNAQEWGYIHRASEKFLGSFGLRLEAPDFQSPRLKQHSYVVRSQQIPHPERYAESMDRAVIGTMIHAALEGSWDALDGLEGAYVLCHPSDALAVSKRSGMVPLCFEFIKPGSAYIGYKRNEYHASQYFMPYIPVQMVRAMDEKTFAPVIKYKTRYGMVGGADQMWFVPGQNYPEVVKVKV